MGNRYRSTNVVIEELRSDAGHPTHVCRGDGGCGTPLLAEDRERHTRFHALVSAAASAIVTEELPSPARDDSLYPQERP